MDRTDGFLFWPASQAQSRFFAAHHRRDSFLMYPAVSPIAFRSAWLARWSISMSQELGPRRAIPVSARYWNDMLLEKINRPVQPAGSVGVMAGQYLIEGQHRLRYSVETANQVQTESERCVFVIDKTAPVFEAKKGADFSGRNHRDGLTAAWLDARDDTLLAEVPPRRAQGHDYLVLEQHADGVGTRTLTLEASDMVAPSICTRQATDSRERRWHSLCVLQTEGSFRQCQASGAGYFHCWCAQPVRVLPPRVRRPRLGNATLMGDGGERARARARAGGRAGARQPICLRMRRSSR
ncbi:hypothetical protein [Streptomyces sp. ST1020]|uniref:hypothetical protein n=1 Tax=Streptomyces sp. ST1020 TaxID=1848901 RepID=UPI0034C6C568